MLTFGVVLSVADAVDYSWRQVTWEDAGGLCRCSLSHTMLVVCILRIVVLLHWITVWLMNVSCTRRLGSVTSTPIARLVHVNNNNLYDLHQLMSYSLCRQVSCVSQNRHVTFSPRPARSHMSALTRTYIYIYVVCTCLSLSWLCGLLSTLIRLDWGYYNCYQIQACYFLFVLSAIWSTVNLYQRYVLTLKWL